MGTLDGIFSKAKEFASVAGNKAQEVAELTKLKMQASQLRADIDSNFQKLGEITYELRKNCTENEELINMCVSEIEAQQQELEDLNKKIDEMKNVAKCPQCAVANPIGALYCARCGHPLKQESSCGCHSGETDSACCCEEQSCSCDESKCYCEAEKESINEEKPE